MQIPRLLALATGAIVVAAAAALLAFGRSDAAAGTAAFPSPPQGATVYSRQLGTQALALAVLPQGGRSMLVQASVLGMQGNGVRGLRFSFTVGGQTKRAAACGPGCYRASFAYAHAPHAVDVTLPAKGSAPWHVQLPAAWPPRDAGALLARANLTWRALHSVTFRETLGSGTGHTALSTWRVQAPDRLAYQVRDGWAGIVIGGRRWDRAPGAKRWQSSPQTPLHQPVPFWVSVTDAHVLGNVRFAGRRAVHASFFDPGSPAWFDVVIDRKTMRTLDVHMVTNAHFMRDTYSAFNATAPVLAPS